MVSTVPFLLPKIFRIRPCKIKFEGDFSSLSQRLYTFLITGNFWEFDPLRLNFMVIAASLHLKGIYFSNCWKIFRIWHVRLNLGVISAVFVKQELSDCRKFLRIMPLRLNVRTISAVYPSIIIYWILPWLLYKVDCSIRVYRLYNVAGAPTWGP